MNKVSLKSSSKPVSKRRGENRSSGNGPLYAAIKRELAEAIREGSLKAGDRVPSESELVDLHGVSRMTANRALRELQAEGLLYRRAGKGTFVSSITPIGQLIEVRNIAEEVKSRGHSYRARVLEQTEVRANKHLASVFGVRAGSRLFHTVIVHHEEEFPIQLEDRYILAAKVENYIDQDFTQITPSEYLTATAPLERVHHRVRAEMPDQTLRQLLAIAPDIPVLKMMRSTWSGGWMISYAVLVHPGDRFELTANFEPEHVR